MPVVKGVKSATERFAGADETYTIEALMQNGWALQSGTSHFLGQNFAKAFDVTFQTDTNAQDLVWATSWGVSTRLVGALIMSHSDDSGLVLPPAVAPTQAVVVPISPKGPVKDPEGHAELMVFVDEAVASLRAAGVRVHVDERWNLKPGNKVWHLDPCSHVLTVYPLCTYYVPTMYSRCTHYVLTMYSLCTHMPTDYVQFYEWERKGVPLRMEVGPRDAAARKVVVARRTGGDKFDLPLDGALGGAVVAELDAMQAALLAAAEARLEEGTLTVASYAEMATALESSDGNSAAGMFLVPWRDDAVAEEEIKKQTKATIRCYPLDRQHLAEGKDCFYSGEPATHMALFSRAF
jgi:prolyl-tRNA synthetase